MHDMIQHRMLQRRLVGDKCSNNTGLQSTTKKSNTYDMTFPRPLNLLFPYMMQSRYKAMVAVISLDMQCKIVI